jgi:ATP-dependent exoDNAse (exonuclease V) beta subunit
MTVVPSDQAARDRITSETGATMFVDAGAGSGKTKSLIDRVCTLVLDDGMSIRRIAAVTFTEKAGAELRDRLRGEFEAAWRADRRGGRGRRAADALDELDLAAIGTLHAFAQRILTLHPIEAGLPPMIEVLDEVGSSVAFDARWAVMQRELLDDEGIAPAVRLAMAAGVKLEHVRSLARAFQSDWDLIEDHVLATDPLATPPLPDIASLLTRALALARRAEECTRDDDRFLPDLDALGAWAAEHAAATDHESALSALTAAGGLKWRWGRAANWAGALDGIKDDCKAWQEAAADARAELVNASLRPLARWVAERVRRAALARAAEGRLEFHDLLVVARDVLRSNADVRAGLKAQFPCLLLDEFQDTDPIQIEIAVRIAGGAAAAAPRWEDVTVPPGSLFVVGDPKQSIYRFRRANISMYLRAQEHFANTVTLDANFRTVGPILEWLNAVFGQVISPAPRAQPAFVPLTPTRQEHPDGPAVVVLGATPHQDQPPPSAATLREREAADVAAVLGRAIDEGWTTYDARTSSSRPLTLGDIAVLVPARTSLPFLEDALDEAAIPYRAESSSLVYQASEVRDLLAAARAVADPSDLLACVTALRSPLFGCGDDDLWTWKQSGSSFNLLATIADDGLEHPVARSLRYLRELYDRSHWMAPSELLGALVTDRRMFEVATDSPRVRDQWRRLRFVVDQARAWSETEHGGLRAYLAWAARQGEETARVAEAVLPETDVDAVRVMTVHAAKGLEFPMVILSGMSSQPRTSGGVRVLWPASGYEVRLTKTVQTNDFENIAPVDEQMDELERRRLLYVAATRARDHLVVSLHRKDAGTPTNASILAAAGAATAPNAEPFTRSPDRRIALATESDRGDLPDWADWAEWSASMSRIRARSRRPSAVSASGLEGTEPAVVLPSDHVVDPGAAKGARDLELPPWSKGRYGTAIGRAVHGVLQAVDLSAPVGLEAAIAGQCTAEGVSEHTDVVRGLVRSALDSDVVRRAATRPYWRESYLGMRDEDGTLLEGFADLTFRDVDGTLVVVDYKTDAVPLEAIPARAQYYAPQLRAYRRATATATGAMVKTVLLFLHPDRPGHEVPVSA